MTYMGTGDLMRASQFASLDYRRSEALMTRALLSRGGYIRRSVAVQRHITITLPP